MPMINPEIVVWARGGSPLMIPFDSSGIANWADKPDAQHQLPELIRRLILATVPTPSLLDIPNGSSSS